MCVGTGIISPLYGSQILSHCGGVRNKGAVAALHFALLTGVIYLIPNFSVAILGKSGVIVNAHLD